MFSFFNKTAKNPKCKLYVFKVFENLETSKVQSLGSFVFRLLCNLFIYLLVYRQFVLCFVETEISGSFSQVRASVEDLRGKRSAKTPKH